MQLFKAPDQKCELGLKGGAGLVVVKRAENGIVLGIGYALGMQAFGIDVGERAFADSYGTFYRNVPGEIEELGHEGIAFENIPSAASAQLRKKLTARASGVGLQVSGFKPPRLAYTLALAGTG